MTVLSIQSQVAFGHVGNSVAVPVLQALGRESWPVPTAVLSNHTGYPDWAGLRFDPDQLRAMLAAVEARGAFAACRAVLTGYVGAPALVPAIAGAIDRLRARNPDVLVVCDPVLGNDAKGLYVPEAMVAAVRERLLPRAGVALPNRFELATLTGRTIVTEAEALDAADALAAMGPKIVVCKSIPDGAGLVTLLRTAEGTWALRTPRLDVAANGAGDLFAAALVGRLLDGMPAERALSLAASAVHAVLEETSRLGRAELALVQSLAEVAAPSRLFAAERLR